mgnify:FL=1
MALLALPAVEKARTSIAQAMQSVPPHRPRPLPAVLRRFALLRRAAPPSHGADIASVQKAFPAWGQPPNWTVDEVVRDVSLAIGVISERLSDSQGLKQDARNAAFGSQVDL